MSRRFPRHLVLAWLFAGALVAAAFPGRAQEGAYASRMPELDQVLADYAASDPTEARIQQAAACHVLSDAVELFMGARYFRNDYRGDEKQRRETYGRCVGDRVGTRAGDTHAMRSRIVNGEGDLRRDPAFAGRVVGRYLPAGDQARYRELKAKVDGANAQRAAAPGRPSPITPPTSNRAGKTLLVLGAIGVTAVLIVALAILSALRNLAPFTFDAASDPPRLKARGRTYDIGWRGGVIVQLDKQHQTHYVPGSTTYDGQGRVVGSTSGRTFTTTRDTVFLLDKAAAEHAMKLSGWDITARGGHQIGSMWAIRKGRKAGPYLKIWNFSLDRANTDKAQIGAMIGVGLGLAFLLGLATFVLASAWSVLTHHGPSPASAVLGVLVFLGLWIARGPMNSGRIKRFEREVCGEIRERARLDAEEALLRAGGVTGE